MGHYTLIPSEFIFYTPSNTHNELKHSLTEYIKSNLKYTEGAHKKNWLCNINTEFFSDSGIPTIYKDLIISGVYPALDLLFEEIPGINVPSSSIVTEMWYNYYTPGDTQEVHAHTGSTISGVYFLHLQEQNNTVFYSYSAGGNPLVSTVIKANKVEEGDILLFPSSFLHYVLPSDLERITIAFNITCSYGKDIKKNNS
jgi:hypothetical protein